MKRKVLLTGIGIIGLIVTGVAQNIGINLSTPVMPVDIREPLNAMLTDTHAIVNVKYTGSNVANLVGIRSTVRPFDGYGIGGQFEGGYIGLRADTYSTGPFDYFGLVATAAGGMGTNYGIWAYAGDGNHNWAGYFVNRIFAGTHLSIGEHNPQYPLEISSAQAVARLTSYDSDNGSVLELKNLTPSDPFIGAINFNDSINSYPGQISYSNNHFLSFKVNNLYSMLINGQGHVGIGTAPSYPLDIYSNQQGVIKVTTGGTTLASTLEFMTYHPNAEHLGVINFNNPFLQFPGQIAYRNDHNMTFKVKMQERMRIDSLGRIGIGTTTPAWPVDVHAPHSAIRLVTNASENGSVLELRNILTSAPYLGAINFNDSTGSHPGQIGYLKNHILNFRTAHSERMRIDHLGRVGIGVIPSFPLDIMAQQGVIRVISTTADYGSVLDLLNLNSTATYLGAINFNDSVATTAGQIAYLQDNLMTFRVNSLERMRIDSMGRLGIGTTMPAWPIDVHAPLSAIRLVTNASSNGSVLELRNEVTNAPFLGAINFNDQTNSYPGQINYSGNHFMGFKLNHQYRMFISGQGHVGIGTTPIYPLDIYSNQQGVIRIATGTTTNASTLEFLSYHPNVEHMGVINFNNPLSQYPGQIAYRNDHNMTFRVKQLERMRIDSLGRLGIGTTTPAGTLDVVSSQASGRLLTTSSPEGSVLELRNNVMSPAVLGSIYFNSQNGEVPGMIQYRGDDNMVFVVQEEERVRIDSAGRLGLGTTPSWPLDIHAPHSVIRLATNSNGYGSVLELRNNMGDPFFLGSINFNDAVDSNPGQINYSIDNNLSFRTKYNERMRIDSSGRIGIGTTAPLWPIDVHASQSAMRLVTDASEFGSALELRNNTFDATYLGAINFNDAFDSYPGQIGYLATDNLTFRTGHIERMRIDDNGRLGIGTASPLSTLDVHAGFATARVISEDSDHGGRLELGTDYPGSLVLGSIIFNDSELSVPGEIRYGAAHDLIFHVNHAERARFDQHGRLGIGRIPVNNLLEVEGSAYFETNVGFGNETPAFPVDVLAAQGVARLVTTSSVFGSVLELKNALNSPDYIGAINFNNATNGYLGQISYTGDNVLAFRVNGTERLRINSAGLIGVGRIPVTNRLEVEGSASKSSAGDWVANSDARLKTNIVPLSPEEMLEKLLALHGVSFEWNDEKTGTVRPSGVQYGFLAQNIQTTFPTLVEEDNQGFLQTAYGTYDPMMVEAMRALNEKITALQNENAFLKSELTDIRRMLNER